MAKRKLRLSACAKTDRGLGRESNEDSFYLSVSEGIFVVADGMGGHLAGAVASSTAVQLIGETLRKRLNPYIEKRTPEEIQGGIEAAVSAANRAIHSRSARETAMKGMGTTCVAAVFSGSYFVIGHVGDSRAYLLRVGKLQQLTRDHSLLAEAAKQKPNAGKELKFSYLKNVITRAIGADGEVEAESHIHKVQDGDLLLLCTDGLSGYLEQEEIQDGLLAAKGLGSSCDSLVEEAKTRKSDDNVTVVLISAGFA